MKAKFLFGAMAALMVASCSQDEVTSIQQDGISYSVAAGKQSRAADSYCNTDLPESFKVWAQNVDDNSVYINGDKIVNQGGNPVTWIDEGGTRYWPENALNFFAHVNGDGTFAYNNGAPTFDNFTVKDDVKEQLDLMYAVKLNQSKPVGTVNLNFRHALSQVAFQAKNANPYLHVEISGVSVGHIANTATFTYPKANTDQNYTNHTDNPAAVTLPGQGTWSTPTGNKQYDVTFSPITVGSGITNLTCPGTNHENGFDNVLTLMPQTTAAWNPAVKGAEWNGAYFLVDVKLCNIAGSTYNAATDKVLYDGQAAIPVDIAWEQGKRYIYTFIFNDGGDGGYTPNPNDPKPVLTAVKYAVEVDDFVPVNGDSDMNTNVTPEATKYTYTLEYNANGEGVTNLPTNETYSGTEEQYTFKLVNTAPIREGYDFVGWGLTADAESTVDVCNVTKDSPSAIVYAIWKQQAPKYTYTLKFDGNGATTGVPGVLSETTTAESYTFTIPSDVPVKGGNWEFVGWTTDAPANQNMNSPIIKESYALTKDNAEATLYALWKSKTSGGATEDGEGSNPWGNNN